MCILTLKFAASRVQIASNDGVSEVKGERRGEQTSGQQTSGINIRT